MLKKKLYSVSFWLLLFISLVVVETISTFAQNADVTGSWKNASVGMIQYQNQVTGATKPGRGSIFTYKFLPNGNYEFVNLPAGEYTVKPLPISHNFNPPSRRV